MSVTRVASLNIRQFRRFSNIDIPIGPGVTLIAGQNGTSKSTLLGMLAQPFSFGNVRGSTANKPDNSTYTDNYHGLTLSDHSDLTGKRFMYDCDDVFRLSKRHDTITKKYQYETVLSGIVASANSPLSGSTLYTQNRRRKRNTTKPARYIKAVRFVTGPGASHKSGEGNFPHPVIYLGLSRLWPLADSKMCSFPQEALSEQDSEWYVETYNRILCLEEHGNNAQFMDTHEKRKFITPDGEDYDGESCSAGQDNLGQILTAILSFRKLKQTLGRKYRGGMLLIDELDATLHAKAQRELLGLLCEESEQLGLQIVATTHSLLLLENAFNSPLSKKTEVLYLSNSDGCVEIEPFTSYEHIRDHLKVEATPPSKKRTNRVSVVLEDKEGENLFKQICGSRLRNYINVGNAKSIAAGDLKNIALLSSKLPALEDVILIPDGDMAGAWPKRPKNLLPLPGGQRPETQIYHHLFDMKATDPFWKKAGPAYTKQFAIVSKGGTSKKRGNEKSWVKAWYAGQSAYWGQSNAKVFKSWVQANKPECLEFCKKFIKLLRARYKGQIPEEVIARTLAFLEATP